jgi:very-short-patch-repair endonuclease
MKKYPSDAACKQAKTLRRDMTDAEKKIWQMLRSRQIKVTDAAAKCRSGALLPTLPVMKRN